MSRFAVVSRAQVISSDNVTASSADAERGRAAITLAIHYKADSSYHPIKDTESRRWHVRTEYGEFEILTTGVKWYDPRAKVGGGGAIDLAMHILQVSFVDAVKMLTARTEPHG